MSRDLVIEIYRITDKFPTSEKFGFSSQIKRSVVSICLNIAEGSGKSSKKDFANFIRMSIGSLIETDTSLKIAIDLEFIKENDCTKANELIEKIYFKLIGLHKSLIR